MNINYMNRRLERQELIIRIAVIAVIALLVFLAFTTPAIAADGGLQTGKNFGEWFTKQIWYIALAVVAFMIVKFLVKKAWVPLAIFIVLAALCIYIIASPDSLKTIGEKLFKMI